MRLFHAAAALTATSALALTLTACGSGKGSGDGQSSAPASAPSSAPAAAPSDAASGAAPAGDVSATQDPGAGAAAGGAAADRCHTAGLDLSFGPGAGKVADPDEQQQLAVVLKNTTSAACTLQGFPGVDLKSAGGTWSLVRSGVKPKKVTLAAGGSTTFTITYLPWTRGSGTEFKATSVVVTPPDETTSTTLAWPGVGLLLQDAATHPGTYAGPVGG